MSQIKDWATQLPWTSIFTFAALFLFLASVGYAMGRESVRVNEGPVEGFFKRLVSFFLLAVGVLGFIDFVQWMQELPRLGTVIEPLR